MRVAIVGLAFVTAALASGCGGAGLSSSSSCETVATPAPRSAETLTPPRAELDPKKTYSLSFDTSCGTFVVQLDAKLAPHTASSLVKLARSGYYDDTIFHRIVPEVVIQGGDPTQTGGGGPGYSTVDRPPADARYTKGTVAMAKTPTEAAGTSGSQFFVVTGADATLTPDYAIVGKVTDGMDVVRRIGMLGNASEHPTQTVLIRRVTVAVHS